MAFRITCPGCKTTLTLDDDKRGHTVRCENCNKALNIPAASGAKREKELAIQNGHSVKVKAKAAPMPPPEFDEEVDAPKKKRKKKKQSGPGLMVGIMAGGIAVFLLLVGLGGYWVLANRKDPPPAPELAAGVAPQEEKPRAPERIVVPKREDGNPANMKKGGVAIINNIRGSAWRTERKNELRNIGQYYLLFCETYKGAERNLNNFKDYIKRDAPHTIREPIDEGYYVINFKADPREPSGIVAYERDEDNQGFKGHNVVKADGSVQYIPTAELKAALGN